MTWNVRKLISPPFQCTSITNRIFLAYLTVLRLITTVWPEMSENSYLRHFSAQVSQIVFFAYLTVLLTFYNMYDLKLSENSYLRHFSAQVSQIVFLAYLTVLRLITTVWPEISKNSYLRHFSAQRSQIVFLPYLTVLRLITTLWHKMTHISTILVHKYHKSCSFQPFYSFLQPYDLKCQKTHISAISVHKYHKAFS